MATGAPPATATAQAGRMHRYLWLILLSALLAWMLDSVARATGQGICFNLARIVTGLGTLATGFLVGRLGSYPAAGLVVSLAFAVGLLTIWIAPETRGRTLQETDRMGEPT